MKKLFSYLILCLMLVTSAHAQSASSGGAATNGVIEGIPIPAYEANYKTNTYHTTFSAGDVDLANTLASGKKVYIWNWFAQANPANVTINNGLVLAGDVTGPNAEVSSASAKSGTFVGTGFGCGGYFEATLKFDPATVLAGNFAGTWPSQWFLPIEKMLAPTGDNWPGVTPATEYYNENDVFEYIIPGAIVAYWKSTMHAWTGIFPTPGFSDVNNAPQNIMQSLGTGSFLSFHYYGMLWNPATSTTKGYVQYYYDRNPIGSPVSWTQYTNQTSPISGQPWAFGIIDKQHLVIIAGTGIGMTMTLGSWDFWQNAATQCNIVQ